MLYNEKHFPFPAIASLVRMCRKYDFAEQLSAVQLLTFENSTNFDEFDTHFWGFGSPKLHFLDQPALTYDIITLARDNNLFSVLPCAYCSGTTCAKQPYKFNINS